MTTHHETPSQEFDMSGQTTTTGNSADVEGGGDIEGGADVEGGAGTEGGADIADNVEGGEHPSGDVGAGDLEAGEGQAKGAQPDGDGGEPASGKLSLADLLEREGEVAADYLEGLLDIVDADGDIDMDVEGERAVVSIIGDRLRHLVGPDGNVLDALQELTRLAVVRETGVRSRLMLDIGGHRARRRSDLTVLGTKAAEETIASGVAVKLAPMSAFERKVVHDAVAAAGLRSESEGEEPARCVVVLPPGVSPRERDKRTARPEQDEGDEQAEVPSDPA
jgi:spoIIIJ-associated protein